MAKYDKDYSSPDTMSQETAFKVWGENKRGVDQWNAENLSNPKFKYRYSKQLDSFDDLTAKQYYASPIENGYVRASAGTSAGIIPTQNGGNFLFRVVGDAKTPLDTYVRGLPTPRATCPSAPGRPCDWSDRLPVPEDQGGCQSCYVFGAVGAAEGAMAVVQNLPPNERSISLSKMQVMTTPWRKEGSSSWSNCPKASNPTPPNAALLSSEKCCKGGDGLGAGCGGPPPDGDEIPVAPCPTSASLLEVAEKRSPLHPETKNQMMTGEVWPGQPCSGGVFAHVASWISLSKSGSLCSSATFPYNVNNWRTSTLGYCSTCQKKVEFTKQPIAFIAERRTLLHSKDEKGGDISQFVSNEELLMKVLDIQPVAVAVRCVALDSFGRGILGTTDSDRKDLFAKASTGGHGLLLVGYGTCVDAVTTPECTTETSPEDVSPGQKYWKLKDSTGTKNRDKGYVYLARGDPRFGPEGPCGMFAEAPPFGMDLSGVKIL
jgi:hypothetical protein